MRLNHKQGAAGEDGALAFLEKQGCKLVARNWHCAYGEIDLIVKNGNMILFVEVKYRKNQQFGGAAYSISPSKLLKLQRSVEYYLQQHRLNHVPCRLDAVLIQGNRPPEWVQNITG
ncbi:YraN family protein [Neisseria sp. CCUG12390]|uniref:YraN family protein n=1 Tax=Neisseria sp. CCUG12390 TaxID=3392035 RepID=UPI003A102475